MAVEGDFVADLGLLGVDPRVWRVGQDLAFEIGVHVLAQGDVLGVAQAGIGHGLAFDLALGTEDDLALGVALGALDGDGAVAEVLVLENAADGHPGPGDFLALAKQPGDIFDVFGAEFLALAAEALAHLLPEAAGVDEMDLAYTGGGLAVADDPDVGADAGVVEHVGGQPDDGLDQVVLQHVAADLAFARARAAGEEGRAIQDDAEAAAAVFGGAHLGNEVEQE